MKKLFILSILLSFFLCSCNKDPDPEQAEIRAYCYLYHFIPDLENVIWEVDGVEVPFEQAFAEQFPGSILLETVSEEIVFTVKKTGTKEVLTSQLFQLEHNKFFNVIAQGSQEDPKIVIREIDTNRPQSGNVKFQVLHSASVQGPIDVYMGDTTMDKRVVSDLAYLSLSSPFEVSDVDARILINVSNHSEGFNQDSVLISSTFSEGITEGANYLSVLAPYYFDNDSLLTFWLYQIAVE